MLFLQVGEHGREVVIGQLLSMLEIGSFAGGKPPVVDKAATSERLRKDTLLFFGRIEPILVCPLCFAHCFLPFTNMVILSHICQYTNIHNTGEESEYSFIRKGCPSAQAPLKDSPFIPMPKGQGYSGSGSDKNIILHPFE